MAFDKIACIVSNVFTEYHLCKIVDRNLNLENFSLKKYLVLFDRKFSIILFCYIFTQ